LPYQNNIKKERESMKASTAFLVVILAAVVSVGFSQTGKSQAKPRVTGDWTGTWGPLSSSKDGAPPKVYTPAQKKLDCKVELLSNGEWQATFEGECGRPYKYTIKMLGRQAGDVVLFKGTTDLGEKDGGVYDWIGRATEAGEFLGFFTSQKYAGSFQLTRPKS